MPLPSLLYSIFVVTVLIVFALVLAYADWATRQAMKAEKAADTAATPVSGSVHAQPVKRAA